MANREWRIQMQDRFTLANIISAGGTVQVCTAGTPDKATLYDKTGASLANPITPTRGFINFFVDVSVATVDLYGMAPGGQFFVMTGIAPSGPNEILIDTWDKTQFATVPFSIADSVANTEKDTGFSFPAQAIVLDRLHGMGVRVTTLNAGQNVAFGVLSSQSGGSANGLCTNVSLTTAVLKIGVNGSFYSTNAPFMTDSITGKSISYTLDTGTTLGKGFLLIPYRLI